MLDLNWRILKQVISHPAQLLGLNLRTNSATKLRRLVMFTMNFLTKTKKKDISENYMIIFLTNKIY